MKKKEIIGVVVRCVLALTLFTLAIVYYDELKNLDVANLLSFTDNVTLMAGVILGVYIVKALLFVIPASAVYVAVGAVFSTATPVFAVSAVSGKTVNLIFAVLVNLFGIFLEVTVTYILGRFLGKDAVYKMLSKKAAGRKILEKDLQDKASVLVAIRAIPAFPIDFISLFYGASGCRYPKYALLSVAGISWRVILFTVIGDALFSWIPFDKLIFIVIAAIPVGLIYYLVKKFVLEPKKRKKEEEKASEKAGTAE